MSRWLVARAALQPALRLVILSLLLVTLAGCNSSAISSSPPVATSGATEPATESATEPASEEPLDTAVPSDEPSGPVAGDVTQTDTEWGRIWDALPRSFPSYPGSEPASDIGAPASGQFVVPTDVETATAWLKAALDVTGLRTTVSGPLEDGSMRLDSSGPNGCAVQTTIARTGSVTLETVLYGAQCPFA
jgi:hypothetical protein